MIISCIIPTPSLRGADVQTRHRGVVVADLSIVRNPRVDVDVLVLGRSPRNGVRHKHVVQLLAVHVKSVRVSLLLVNAHHGIHILESGNGYIFLERLDKGEFVKVAGRDDLCVLVFGQNLLRRVSRLSSCRILVCYKKGDMRERGLNVYHCGCLRLIDSKFSLWLLETYLDEVCSKRRLCKSVIHTTVHRRSRVAMERAASTLGPKVYVDGEEGVERVLFANHLPLGDERLATSCPC